MRCAPRLFIAVALALAVAGCSSGSDSDPGAEIAPADPPSPTDPPPPLDLPVVPDCKKPAPLSGRPDPALPDHYIVQYEGSIDAAQETARLVAEYGFMPSAVFDYLPGFAAVLDEGVVAALRCEPSVLEIFYDAIINPPEEPYPPLTGERSR